MTLFGKKIEYVTYDKLNNITGIKLVGVDKVINGFDEFEDLHFGEARCESTNVKVVCGKEPIVITRHYNNGSINCDEQITISPVNNIKIRLMDRTNDPKYIFNQEPVD